mmetsp:Transcript_131774/g.381096  ORF Transcript_131774/g.381096 Transcript_131774/m.381096 type:complete len:215 (-) Transcript_131774:333-977(-)
MIRLARANSCARLESSSFCFARPPDTSFEAAATAEEAPLSTVKSLAICVSIWARSSTSFPSSVATSSAKCSASFVRKRSLVHQVWSSFSADPFTSDSNSRTAELGPFLFSTIGRASAGTSTFCALASPSVPCSLAPLLGKTVSKLSSESFLSACVCWSSPGCEANTSSTLSSGDSSPSSAPRLVVCRRTSESCAKLTSAASGAICCNAASAAAM